MSVYVERERQKIVLGGKAADSSDRSSATATVAKLWEQALILFKKEDRNSSSNKATVMVAFAVMVGSAIRSSLGVAACEFTRFQAKMQTIRKGKG